MSAMNLRLPVFLLLLLACAPLHADLLDMSDEKKKKAKKAGPELHQEGWLKKTVHSLWPFGKKPGEPEMAPPPKGSQSGKEWKELVPTLSIEPLPLQLKDVRTMKVTLRLANKGKKMAQLDFPTTQRIEVLVKDAAGNRVEQWSEDQSFQNEPTLVAINPGERLEYAATVATRDLKAGQAYTIEGFFPNYDQLRVSKQITPLP